MFFVQRQPVVALFGYLIVPYTNMTRSLVLDKYHYGIVVENGLIVEIKTLSMALTCDLINLWSHTCEPPSEPPSNGVSKVFLFDLALVIFICVLY